MNSGQQLMVGMDIKIPSIVGTGALKYTVKPSLLVSFKKSYFDAKKSSNVFSIIFNMILFCRNSLN